MKKRVLAIFVILFVINISLISYLGNSEQFSDATIGINKIQEASSYKLDKNVEDLKIIQFKGPIENTWKELLENNGVIFKEYIPENAFIVKITTENADHLNDFDFVSDIVDYKLEYKVDDSIFDEDKGLTAKKAGDKRIEVNILFEDENNSKEILDILEDNNIHVTERSNDTIKALVHKDQIDDIAKIEKVDYIEKSIKYEITNDVAATIIEANNSWINYGLTGAGQIIGISDSGLDSGADNNSKTGDIHLDIDNRATLFNWYGTSPDDKHGHGTHVTGSVAGNGSRSNGVIKGMAYNARIVMQALGDDDGSNSVYPPSNLNDLFQEAYDNGSRIHTSSWGANSNSYNSDAKEVDEFMWNHTDILIFFAAGNNGASGTNTVGIPASNKNGLAIASTENNRPDKGAESDDMNSRASSSSKGPTHDGRIKPDLAAPGTYILSMLSNLTSNPCGRGNNGTFYTFCSGTSMATPIAAGAAALVRQYLNDNLSLNASAAMVKAVMIHGAQDIGYGLISNETGFGRINITNSLFPPHKEVRHIDNKTGLNTGETSFYTFHSNNNSVQFKVTITWTDYPSTTSAETNLVNDLDLTIMLPNGTIYLGNNLEAPYDDRYDNINNVEVIWINNGPVGDYTINISARNVPNGPQPYALVVSGSLDESLPSITFINNTPDNNSLTSNTSIMINISSNESLNNAILEWNGTNQTMNGSGMNWYVNKTLRGNGTISFKVFGNDSGQNIGVSELRYIIFQNSIPTIITYFPNSTNVSIKEPNNQVFNISYSDINGDDLTIVWANNGTNVSSYNNFTFFGNYSTSGNYNITVIVFDSWGNTTRSWLLIVNESNEPPQINSVIINSSDDDNRTNGTLNGFYNYNDTENDSITANETWWFKNGVLASNLTNKSMIGDGNTTKAENWIVSLRIFDGNSWSNWTNSTSMYIKNSAPIVIQPENITINETKSINITINASDDDNDNLTYRINNTLFSVINNQFNYTSRINESGNIVLMINVTDGNMTINKTLTIAIIDQPDFDNDEVIDVEDNDDDNDGLNDTMDKLTGNVSSINSTSIVKFFINNSENSSKVLNESVKINITDYNNNTILEFDWNFSNNSLTVNWTVDYISANGTLVVKGIDLSPLNYTKTVYINKSISSNNYVCILDQEVTSINEMSTNCDGANELKVPCSGSNGPYTCSSNGNYFKVSGLNHSAVKPISVSSSQSSSSSSSSGGGGGGGGSSGGGSATAAELNPTTVSKYFAVLSPTLFPSIVVNAKLIPVSLITFNTFGTNKDVVINISALNESPPYLGYEAYKFIKINSNKLTNEDILNTEITVKVPLSWINEMKLAKEDISIFHYRDDWVKVIVKSIKTEKDFVFYIFNAPLFSFIAISSEKLKSVDDINLKNDSEIKDDMPNVKVDIGEIAQKDEKKDIATYLSAPSEKSQWILKWVIVSIIVLFLNVIIIKKMRSKRKARLSKINKYNHNIP